MGGGLIGSAFTPSMGSADASCTGIAAACRQILALLRLDEICSHPALAEKKKSEIKLDELLVGNLYKKEPQQAAYL